MVVVTTYVGTEVACKVYLDLSYAKIDIFGLKNNGTKRIVPVSMSSKSKSKLPSGETMVVIMRTTKWGNHGGHYDLCGHTAAVMDLVG
jgi:hypothetical protein